MKNANATLINKYIAQMLKENIKETSYHKNYHCIKRTFQSHPDSCDRELTQEDIYRQLVVIDTLYSTNIQRMRKFGLEELTDSIWGLCKGNNHSYTLGNLSGKLIATLPLNPAVKALFSQSFGYIKGSSAGKAPSLISKYFYFATIACPQDDWGFPIYDSIVCDLLRPLERFLGIYPLTPQNQIDQSSHKFDIEIYREGLKRIIDVLEEDNPALWNNSGKLKFDLLDFFLWHIGKAKKNPSPLLTKNEYLSNTVPNRIRNWASYYDKIVP